jgi:hypothetical protein
MFSNDVAAQHQRLTPLPEPMGEQPSDGRLADAGKAADRNQVGRRYGEQIPCERNILDGRKAMFLAFVF